MLGVRTSYEIIGHEGMVAGRSGCIGIGHIKGVGNQNEKEGGCPEAKGGKFPYGEKIICKTEIASAMRPKHAARFRFQRSQVREQWGDRTGYARKGGEDNEYDGACTVGDKSLRRPFGGPIGSSRMDGYGFLEGFQGLTMRGSGKKHVARTGHCGRSNGGGRRGVEEENAIGAGAVQSWDPKDRRIALRSRPIVQPQYTTMEMFSAVSSLVSPFVGGSSGGVVDGMKLVVLGGTVETARRVSSSAWNSFVNSFYLTARFSEDDYPYDWLMHWQQPAWGRSREFETTTRTNVPGAINSGFGDEFEDLEAADDDDAPGKQKMRVVFMPTLDTTHTIYYKGHWLRVCRSRQSNGDELLSISVVARSNNILKQLVLEAKKEYERDAEHRVQIFFADSVRRRRRRRSRQSSSPSQHGSWRWTDSRQKRPMSSIVLAPGVKEMLLSDTRDFLKSEKWYADRGIPFRRGYLLHGVPGSGKSSLIHAIAGELALDIYVVSLSSSWINDATLTALMGRVPARCIVLLEDLDAAFTRSTSRDGQSTGAPTNDKKDEGKDKDENNKDEKKQEDVNTLSLSGLLNALDGVAASEGRILFATTNHLERLDPALSRPGRMDVWIEFKNATKWQCEQLFNNFFPAASADNIPPGPPPSLEEEKRAAGLPVEDHELDCNCRKKEERLPDGTLTPTLTPAKRLDAATLAQLAKKFAASIPEEEFSVASLQGYLLKNKTRPQAAADEAAAWVISERELKARLQREKEEREAKERADREKRRREREEKERRDREEERERKRREEREQARLDREADDRERERKAKEEKERLEKESKDKAGEEPKKDEPEPTKLA
ncbi:P-loop containing nucleoside triphosphate hydrolase protein [Rhizoctonia solani]|uniref:P-loop containing nucleoside triphosphate hydrolase protein n=3 Tax=Rhizoctonia solani TaxID=456999 RepID=A0A8H7M6K4_9AGAM|nr:P-loop containing nucleoside triphosphate hydrolase protein [Rhizoctonia solani]